MKKREWSIIFLIWAMIFGVLYSDRSEALECEFFDKLTPYQIDIANMSYKAGLPYDLGLTAVAIAWEESRLGLYKVRHNVNNMKDMSYGIMHTVAYWKVKKMSSFDAGNWVQDMITDDAKSIDVGIQDILYWQNAAKGNWLKGVGMYNGGWKPNKDYGQRIVKTVRKLKECVWL